MMNEYLVGSAPKQRKRWTRLADIPVGVYLHTLEHHNGKLYLFGGRVGATGSQSSNRLFVYDIQSNSWTEITTSVNKPTGRYFHTSAPSPNGFYSYGGREVTTNVYLDQLLEYDISANSWKTLAAGVPSEGHGMTVMEDGALVAFGGRQGGTYHTTSRLYRPETNAWGNVGPASYQSTFFGGFSPSMGSKGNVVYYHGGWTSAATRSGVASLKLGDNFYTLSFNAPPPRYQNAYVMFDGKLFAFGGLAESAGGQVTKESAVRIDFTRSNSSTIVMSDENGPEGGDGMAATVAGDLIYLSGGRSIDSTKVLNELWAFDPLAW